MVYVMCMYVKRCVELAQRGIALQKSYVLLLLINTSAMDVGIYTIITESDHNK